jgi:hypothetical protein
MHMSCADESTGKHFSQAVPQTPLWRQAQQTNMVVTQFITHDVTYITPP